MQRKLADTTITVPVPDHRELRIGTLLSIIRQSQLSRELFEEKGFVTNGSETVTGTDNYEVFGQTAGTSGSSSIRHGCAGALIGPHRGSGLVQEAAHDAASTSPG